MPKVKESRKRERVYISEAQQNQMIQDFIDGIPEPEQDPQFYEEPRTFIGDEEDVDFENEEESESDEEAEPVLPRKIRYKSLDEVTDLNIYDSLPAPDTNQRIVYNTKDGKNEVIWNSQKQKKGGRSGNQNVITERDGPRGAARNANTEISSWSLFIDEEMLIMALEATNSRIFDFRERFRVQLERSSKYSYCKEATVDEIRAVFGILYLRASKHLNLQNYRDVYSHESSLDIFESTMSQNRFIFLVRMLSFDDKNTRSERWKLDKFAAFREFFEKMNVNNAKARTPSFYTSIDETLYPYRGHIGLKQYNPSKPSKYGLLYRSLCDASTPYTYWTLPYAGKPDVLGSEFYVTGTDEYTKYLVEKFSNHGSLVGRNISLDRYFTSISIAEWCLSKKITIVGTMRHDRKGIAQEIKSLDEREEKSVKWWYKESDEKNMIVSFVDKKKKGMKNIVVLTTMHDTVSVTKDQRRKPNVIVFYDYTKGGVDVVDLIAKMSTRIKNKRWIINSLAFVLDTARTNAKTIFMENTKSNISNFEFTWNLGKALVLPQLQRRIERPVGLQTPLQQKIRKVTGHTSPAPEPAADATCGRCYVCLREIQGPGYKKAKCSISNQTKTKCRGCKKVVCRKHSTFTCNDCGHD